MRTPYATGWAAEQAADRKAINTERIGSVAVLLPFVVIALLLWLSMPTAHDSVVGVIKEVATNLK